MTVRIDEIEVVNLRFEYPPGQGFTYAGGTATGRLTTLVRVHADGGRVGIGSAYTHPELARLIIEGQLAPYLRGTEITEPPAAWQDMMRLVRWYGRAGVAVTALGAVDTALWDLRAQDAGQPLWRYLGGTDDSVPAYASALLWRDDLDLLREEAARYLDEGFVRVKMRLGRCRDYDEAAFLAVHETVSGRGQVIVDGSLRFSDDDAAWLGGILAGHGAVWFEEPFEPDNIDAYVALKTRTAVPLAAGENETSPRGLGELVRPARGGHRAARRQPRGRDQQRAAGGGPGQGHRREARHPHLERRHRGAGQRARHRVDPARDDRRDRPHRQPVHRRAADRAAPGHRRAAAAARGTGARRPAG